MFVVGMIVKLTFQIEAYLPDDETTQCVIQASHEVFLTGIQKDSIFALTLR